MMKDHKVRKNGCSAQMKGYIFGSCIAVLLPMLVGICIWHQLPERVATHFGSDNLPNGWSSREFAVFGLPLFIFGAHLVCILFTMADPKRNRINGKMWNLILAICPLCSMFCCISIYGYALSWKMNIDTTSGVFLGIIFMIVGNYLPKCRQNYTVGIKLPWTLNDEQNWNQTHRIAGRLWMLCGFFIIVNAFLDVCGVWLEGGMIAASVIVPVIYSYVFYMRHQR